jgi:glycosyltransferase involved in cell wall biosynthesis
VNSRATRAVKVLRVIARLNIGGPARHATILHEGLAAAGFETVLAHGSPTSDEGSFEELLADRGLRSIRVPALGRRVSVVSDVQAFWALLRLVFAEQPDVLHTHTAKAGTLGRLAGWIYNLTRARRRRCLLVHTFHGHVFDGYFGPVASAAVQRTERALARLSDLIVTISPRQQDEIVGRFRIAPADKVLVVPLGLELDQLLTSPMPRDLRSACGWTGDEFVIGFVGRLVAIKDVPTLIRGFAAFSSRCPQARLLVAGDGERRSEAEQLVRSLGLDRLVRFVGWQRDLLPLYGAMDAMALTSKNEGTPVAIIEALAAAVPAVATDVGGVGDVIEHEATGLLIPPGDAQALAAALERLATDPALRQRLSDRGRSVVAARFGRQRLIQEMAACYRRLLVQRDGPANPSAGSFTDRPL